MFYDQLHKHSLKSLVFELREFELRKQDKAATAADKTSLIVFDRLEVHNNIRWSVQPVCVVTA